MEKVFALLTDLLPLEIAGLIVIFLYFLKVFKDLASQFVSISQQQAEYMRQRVDSIDKTTSIFERTVEHQEKDLKRLYEVNEQMKRALEDEKGQAIARLDDQLGDIVKSMEDIRRERLSKEEFDRLTDEVNRVKRDTLRHYDATIEKLAAIDTQSEDTPSKIEHVFLAMPCTEDNKGVLDIVGAELTAQGITALRATKRDYPGEDIATSVRLCIDSADFVVADISANNPNVMYELGYAHGHGKPVILLTTSDKTAIPFDVLNYRVILYEDSMSGVEVLKQKLRKTVEELRKQAKQEQMKKWLKAVAGATPYTGGLVKAMLNAYIQSASR